MKFHGVRPARGLVALGAVAAVAVGFAAAPARAGIPALELRWWVDNVQYYDDTPEDYPYAAIERYELTGRQIIVYISNLNSETPLTFNYHLLAKFPLRVQTPASSAYDYYNPGVAGEQPPQTLVVSE